MGDVGKSVKESIEEDKKLTDGCALKLDSEEGARLMKDFDYLRLTCSDLNGVGRCKAVPRRHFGHVGKRGIDVPTVTLAMGPRGELPLSMPELSDVRFLSNINLLPMAGTLRSLPWAADGKFRVGEVLCEPFWIKPYSNGGHVTADPRYVARKQLEGLDKLGFSLYSSYEVEFGVFKYATAGEQSRSEMSPVFAGNSFMSSQHLAEFESYLYTLDSHLHAAGIDIETIQTEYASGQFELALKPRHGIAAADGMFCMKRSIKEITTLRDKNMAAVFMTKPDTAQLANGLHYNHSLWYNSGDKLNAFYDPSDSNGLSVTAKHWIAGLIKHGPGLAALCSPTVNCYRRMHQICAPSRADWAFDDRTAAFRAKSVSPTETYIENRVAGGGANPYLILAATVAAGISGIVNKLECPPQRQGNEVVMPKTLSEALDALESDQVLVQSLGEEFIRWFVNIKRNFEVKVLTNDSIEEERISYQMLF